MKVERYLGTLEILSFLRHCISMKCKFSRSELYFTSKHKEILYMFLEGVFIGGFLNLAPGAIGPALQPGP